MPTLRVLAQKSLGLSVMEKSLADYEKKSGTKVEISYFGENDRRAKSRLDASTGAGSYQIYYVDEANVAEFASANWIVPLLKYYPKEYDYDDFLPGRRAVASYNGVAYFAPLIGGGDFLFYRRDLLDAAHIRCRRRSTSSSPRSSSTRRRNCTAGSRAASALRNERVALVAVHARDGRRVDRQGRPARVHRRPP